MRISTVTIFEQSLNAMNRQQGEFLRVGQQIASGRRVLNPSDDPQAAARAVGLQQSIATNQQFADARISTRNALSQEESVLNSIADAITSAKTRLVQAGNDTLSDADRTSIASDLKGIYEALVGLGNSADGNGRYLFAGYKDNSPPFVKSPAGNIEYQGDEGVIAQQVDSARQMPSSDNGRQIFQSVHSASGFLARAADDNAGTLTFKGPAGSGAAGFELSFAVDASGGVTYSTDGGTTHQPYTPGQTVSVNGLSLTLEGIPADGDRLTVSRAQDAKPDLFRTLEDMIARLDTPVSSPVDQAALRNTLATSMRELDNALDNVLTVRASVGSRLNELDMLDTVAGNRLLNYEQTLSELVDLDYNKAVSEYALRRVGLQAAQKAFLDVQNLSIFDRM